MIFSNFESIIWFSLLILFIIFFFVYHKRKLKQVTSHISNRLRDTEAEKSTLETEKKKKEEKSRKIWDMSEAVYREKRKVDQKIGQLRIETEKLEQEKKKFKEKNVKLWEQSIAIHKEKTKIALLHKEITDSIRYAERIQNAILPTDEQVAELLPESFVLFKPKDIVSGDFYWAIQTKNNKVIWAAVDCTGHGVPGAFMSMIGNTLLNEIVIEKGITEPARILNELKMYIIDSLGQTGVSGEHRDGMDIALCALDKKTNKLEFAGAYNPLYIVRTVNNNKTVIPSPKDEESPSERREESQATNYQPAGDSSLRSAALLSTQNDRNIIEGLEVIKADRQPIGYEQGKDQPFTNHEIQLQKGDTLYTFSDGYADQYGGDDDSSYGKGKKFSRRRFKELVLSLQQKSMTEQKETFDTTIENYKGDLEQIDDILVIGVRI